jgi:hypothetical protein
VSPKEMQDIAAACVREAVRQRVDVDDLGRLLQGYDMALARAEVRRLPTLSDVQDLAGWVDRLNSAGFRRVAVTFDSGGHAADWRDVPSAVERLFAVLDEDTDPAEFVRALLAIHPWADGNGRVAFVVFNWLAGTLRDPQPLPEFEW